MACVTHVSATQAIALYQMVRAPIYNIPVWIVQVLQVRHNTLTLSYDASTNLIRAK